MLFDATRKLQVLGLMVSVPVLVQAATLHLSGDTASVVFNEHGADATPMNMVAQNGKLNLSGTMVADDVLSGDVSLQDVGRQLSELMHSPSASCSSTGFLGLSSTEPLAPGLYVVGNNASTNLFRRFDVSTDLWSDAGGSVFWERRRHSVIVLDGYVYIIAGLSLGVPVPYGVGSQIHFKSASAEVIPARYQVERVPLAGGGLEQVAAPPADMNPAAHSSAVLNGALYVLSSGRNLFMYNVLTDAWMKDPNLMNYRNTISGRDYGYGRLADGAISAALVAHGGYLYALGGPHWGNGQHSPAGNINVISGDQHTSTRYCCLCHCAHAHPLL